MGNNFRDLRDHYTFDQTTEKTKPEQHDISERKKNDNIHWHMFKSDG